MKTFFNVEDLGDLKAALAEAQEVKANRFGYQELGKNKTLLMIFFNNSLRTRLSNITVGESNGVTTGAGNWRQSVASSWMATRANICWKLSQ